MKVQLNQDDIKEYKAVKFNEYVAVFKHDSPCFREFDAFVQSNTNFLDSRIGLMDVQYVVDSPEKCEDDPPANYLILKLWGGKNGPGKWTEYLDDIHTLFVNLSKKYETWLVDIDNDCADDIFYVTLCVR